MKGSPECRINHNTDRCSVFRCTSHGKSWVVSNNSSDSDNNSIDTTTLFVHKLLALLATYPRRISFGCFNISITRLSPLTCNPRETSIIFLQKWSDDIAAHCIVYNFNINSVFSQYDSAAVCIFVWINRANHNTCYARIE